MNDYYDYRENQPQTPEKRTQSAKRKRHPFRVLGICALVVAVLVSCTLSLVAINKSRTTNNSPVAATASQPVSASVSDSAILLTDVSDIVKAAMPSVVSITSRALVSNYGMEDILRYIMGGRRGSLPEEKTEENAEKADKSDEKEAPEETEAEKQRQKEWKRRGLLLRDEQVLQAMEPGENPTRMCYSVKKDGTLSGDLADREQMRLLQSYIFRYLGKMVEDIASGNVSPNPYTRGSKHNACAFCPYGSICHKDTVEGRRNYKTMTAQRFWEDVEKEVRRHGG